MKKLHAIITVIVVVLVFASVAILYLLSRKHSVNRRIVDSGRIPYLHVYKGEHVTIKSNTTIYTEKIQIESGGTLLIKGENIHIYLDTHSINTWDRRITVCDGGTLLALSTLPCSTLFTGLPTAIVSGDYSVTIPNTYTPWRPGDQVVLTGRNNQYCSDTNPYGGIPYWLNWDDPRYQEQNEHAIETWEQGTFTGVERLTIATIESVPNSEKLLVTFTTPCRYAHLHNTHMALLSASITFCTVPTTNSGPWYNGCDTLGFSMYVQNGGILVLNGVAVDYFGQNDTNAAIIGDPLSKISIHRSSFSHCLSSFIATHGNVQFTDNVCFWGKGSGLVLKSGASGILHRNAIIGVHAHLDGTPWSLSSSGAPFAAAMELRTTSISCLDNILCCSPRPVVGLWAQSTWIYDTSDTKEPFYIHERDYKDNVCYNMEGYWCQWKTEHTHPSSVVQIVWVRTQTPWVYNTGAMDWSYLIVQDSHLYFQIHPIATYWKNISTRLLQTINSSISIDRFNPKITISLADLLYFINKRENKSIQFVPHYRGQQECVCGKSDNPASDYLLIK